MTALDEPMVLDDVDVRNHMHTTGDVTKEEKVGYYRKPAEYTSPQGVVLPFREPRWITTADTQPLKQIHYLKRGWQPLPQFGWVTGSHGEQWRPILTHRDGPALFPVDQLLAYRWYDPSRLPGSLRNADIYFPQLVGVEVTEYECPECSGRSSVYLEPFHLARHLINKHSYDRAAIIALGESLGIDFNKSITKLIAPKVRTFEARELPPEPVGATSVARVRRTRPASQREMIGMPVPETATDEAENDPE